MTSRWRASTPGWGFALLVSLGISQACTSSPAVTVPPAPVPVVTFQAVTLGPATPDLLPYDENAAGDLLAGSSRQGYVVFRRGPDGRFEPHRNFAVGHELPADILYGEAVFGDEGTSIFAAGLGRGLVHLSNEGARWLTMEEGLRGRDIWHVWRHPATGHLWLVFRPLPFRDSKGGIQRFDGFRAVGFTALSERAYATINDLLYHPERGTVLTAGVAGVLEFDAAGRFERRSFQRAAGLAYDPGSKTVVAVGGTVERWDGGRFQPVLFRVDHPRHPPGTFALPPALDIAIDRRGDWFILYPEGHLLHLSSAGAFLRLLDIADGVPRSAQQLLYLRVSDQLAIGSTREGMVLLAAEEI